MKHGKQIVLTAPFTEMIDHAGYFIQMGMASIPIWMEWVMDKKYPEWRNVKRFKDNPSLLRLALNFLLRSNPVIGNIFGKTPATFHMPMATRLEQEKSKHSTWRPLRKTLLRRRNHLPKQSAFWVLLFLVWNASSMPARSQTNEQAGYLLSPQDIVNILDAPQPPDLVVSPTFDVVALLQRQNLPAIGELALPMHRLAGMRINPRNSTPWKSPPVISISLLPIDSTSTSETRVLAPRGTKLGWVQFSPSGSHLSYAVIRDTGVELWVINLATRTPRPLTDASLNATWGNPCEWLADSSGVLCRFRMSARGAPPVAPKQPAGPNIQEHNGKPAKLRSFQDLLENQLEEELFAYHFTNQIATVELSTGRRSAIGSPGVFSRVHGAPDSDHILVERLTRPFSRTVPADRFSKSIEVWNRDGSIVSVVAAPVSDTVPVGGVRTGQRAHQWNPTESATLVWAEALDDGDPRIDVTHRDSVRFHRAPFDGTPTEIYRTEFRLTDISWTQSGTALVSEFDRKTRWTRSWILDAITREARRLFDRSAEDIYSHPGRPLLLPGNKQRRASILEHNNNIYLAGRGASPQGDYPFIDRLDLDTLATERIFQAKDNSYERVVSVLDPSGTLLLTRHESQTEPPNYVVRNVRSDTQRSVTNYTDPAPILRTATRQLLTYERNDGVTLSATLFLPPNYKQGEQLPLLIWAYPREFTNREAASQVRGSQHRFTELRGASHLFLLTQGYAIIDGPSMPIIGDGETANDKFIEQLVSSASAVIDTVVDLGVADRDRIIIGGHSYGAFMAANLLAHSDLFQAGIARSGAYNRTLTPFGFQNERRTFWQAKDIHSKISPFFHVSKLEEPLLLIHGEIDDNAGTFPIQSERMFSALKGHGTTVRYVTLPYESHTYSARESILHVITEMLRWCDKHIGPSVAN